MEKSMSELPPLRNEYPQRMERARSIMGKVGIDALLLFTGVNLFYFAGNIGGIRGRSGSRPFVFVLPLQKEPFLIVHNGRQYETHAMTDITDIRTYTRLSQLPLEKLLTALDERGLIKARIGMELSGEMVLDLPYQEYERLRANIPDAKLIDASQLIWQLRMIKSKAEIARIEKACAITGEAYSLTFRSIHPGFRETDIESMMYRNMLELGGRSPWVMITSGSGNYDVLTKSGSHRVIEPGDMIWMDCGCAVDGYWSDFSRAGVVGGPSPEQEEAQREIHEITRMGVNMVRPGVPVAEIAARCNEALETLGWQITSNISGLASRVGHGIGMNITELPSLNEEDPTVLAPGTVVTIEPGVATTYGTFHIEENVLVTEEEPRVLTTPDWKLWTI
jgi:Xaa-Pro aminopeptidase